MDYDTQIERHYHPENFGPLTENQRDEENNTLDNSRNIGWSGSHNSPAVLPASIPDALAY